VINIKDHFIGQDPTGRCLFTNFTIARVIKGDSMGEKAYEYNKVLSVDEFGNLKFSKMIKTMDWRIFFKVYNSFEWFEFDQYVSHLKI
jgi:hypothetical protein